MDDVIEIELDSGEIAVLKEGGGVNKETDNPDLPVLFIYKWDVIKEIQTDMEGKEGFIDVLYEADAVINEKRQKYRGSLEGE